MCRGCRKVVKSVWQVVRPWMGTHGNRYMSYRFADSLRAGSGRNVQAVSKPVWHITTLCLQWRTPDDGQRNCPKHVEFYSKNKFQELVHLVGFILRIYHDARSPDVSLCKLFYVWSCMYIFLSPTPDLIFFYSTPTGLWTLHCNGLSVYCLNLLTPELVFLILARPVYKMWIIQEPNTLELWKKTAFWRGKNGEYIPWLKNSVPIFVE
jgi:hypothetical protein